MLALLGRFRSWSAGAAEIILSPNFSDLASEGSPVPIYECCSCDENDKVVSVEVLGDDENIDVRREAMRLTARFGRCARYEIWTEGRILEAYQLS